MNQDETVDAIDGHASRIARCLGGLGAGAPQTSSLSAHPYQSEARNGSIPMPSQEPL